MKPIVACIMAALLVAGCGHTAKRPASSPPVVVEYAATEPPRSASKLSIQLPASDGPAHNNELATVLAVTIGASGAIFIDTDPIADDKALLRAARDLVAKNKNVRAIIAADDSVSYGRVIHVLDLLIKAGINNIAFAVTPRKNERPALAEPKDGADKSADD